MNIKEVARVARVSTATVSRTINGSDKVTAKTAERVQRAIKALNYYPDTNARALGSGRSRLYGLIISDITNPFFSELAKGFEDVAIQIDREVLIANTNYDRQRMEKCVVRMLQRKVDGVAIMTSEMDDHLIEEMSNRKIPLVFLDTGTPQRGISNIVIDYAAGIDAAVKHLRALGHRNIGFLSGPMDLTSARTRRKAFLASMKRNGLNPGKEMIAEGNHHIDGGYRAMAQLLEKSKRPTAVMTSNDMTALGAMGAIFQHGLKVPDDISVVGFDDIGVSAFMQPALTTVQLSRTEIAKLAFRALQQIENSATRKGAEFHLEPKLVARGSTAPARD